MDLQRIIGELQSEKRRIELAINALEGGQAPHRRGRKFMDAVERRDVSERMKKYWANRRSKTKIAG